MLTIRVLFILPLLVGSILATSSRISSRAVPDAGAARKPAASLGAWEAPKDAAGSPDIPTAPKEGYYTVTGTLPGGKGYESLASIQKHKETWVVRWYQEGAVVTGIGILDEGKLVIGFALPVGGPAGNTIVRGVASLRLTTRGLAGSWAALPGDGRRGAEKWEYLRALPKVPEASEL